MMRARKKKTSGLDMVRPTSFYSNESEKIKLNWFCYELSMGIYDNIKKEIGSRLKKQKISDEGLAEFSVLLFKGDEKYYPPAIIWQNQNGMHFV